MFQIPDGLIDYGGGNELLNRGVNLVEGLHWIIFDAGAQETKL